MASMLPPTTRTRPAGDSDCESHRQGMGDLGAGQIKLEGIHRKLEKVRLSRLHLGRVFGHVSSSFSILFSM